jgi:hypothetical protein
MASSSMALSELPWPTFAPRTYTNPFATVPSTALVGHVLAMRFKSTELTNTLGLKLEHSTEADCFSGLLR